MLFSSGIYNISFDEQISSGLIYTYYKSLVSADPSVECVKMF